MAVATTNLVWAHANAAGLNFNTVRTKCYWFQRTGDIGGSISATGNSPIGEEDEIEASGNANIFPVANDNGSFAVGGQVLLSINTWYFICERRTDANTYEMWVGDLTTPITLISSAVVDMSARSAATYDVLGARGPAGTLPSNNSRFDSLNIWNRAHSEAEMDAQRLFQNAQITTDLWAQVPFQTDGNDTSGNGNNYTVTGTPSYVTGPAIDRSGGVIALPRGPIVQVSQPIAYMEV